MDKYLSDYEILLLRGFIEKELEPFKEENAKLTRLLAEACEMLDRLQHDSGIWITSGSEELTEWIYKYKKHKQQEEKK